MSYTRGDIIRWTQAHGVKCDTWAVIEREIEPWTELGVAKRKFSGTVFAARMPLTGGWRLGDECTVSDPPVSGYGIKLVYEVVPEDEVPDDIWAALMLLRLGVTKGETVDV